jgi:prophage antirepressor-like protein
MMIVSESGQSNSIRVVDIDGQPWFVATDACRVLGLNMTSGTYRHLRKLNRDERRLLTGADLPQSELGRAPSVTAISESGLYKLIMRSDKAVAKPFQDWVTRVVLPSIRKHGGYIPGQEKVATGELTDAELMAPEKRRVLSANTCCDWWIRFHIRQIRSGMPRCLVPLIPSGT